MNLVLKLVDTDELILIAVTQEDEEVRLSLFEWAIPDLFFFIFIFSTVNSKNVHKYMFTMIGFKLRTSDIGRDLSAN